MKTLCLESTLHIMLSRPIWPCIRKKGWTGGILSMLQLIRSNHGLQWAAGVVICCRKTQISDGWKAGREWHQSQNLSTEHSDLSCLIKDEAFGNTSIVACLSLLHAHSAAKVFGSEFCNIQLTCHLIPPWFRSLTLSKSQHVSGSSWESVDPNASHYKVSFTWVHNLTSKNLQTDYHEVSVICKLKGSHNALSSRIHASNG